MLHLDRRSLLLSGAGVATSAALVTFDSAEALAAAGRKKQTKVFTGHFRGTVPDWKYLPFRVPKGVWKISVSYDYTPIDLGPISQNVVDIGIFDPSGHDLGDAAGFRGWSGGARRSFFLTKHAATPGYLAGRIEPGVWRIALGPYQITPVGTPYRVKVTLHFGKQADAFVATPAPQQVTPPEQKTWWRGDLHVHTVHSDGSQTQADVIGYAQAAGLDFIGTSEHNTSSATRTWGRYVPEGFLVINGEEVTTRTGHWLATGLPEVTPKGRATWIDWRYRPEDGKLAGFTQQVRDLGGLSIAAHPYQAGAGITWGFGYEFDEMDAVEVWNGPWSGLNATANNRAVSGWHSLLTNGVFKPAVGNSDTHRQSQTIGLAQTVVRAATLSAEALLAGYRLGHSWITGSSAVDLAFTATLDDVSGECGDRVPSSEGQEVDVHLRATGVPVGAVARLIGPGAASYGSAIADADGVVVVDGVVPGGTSFVRAEIRTGAGTSDPMVAMTNPIFLTAATSEA